MAIQDVVVMAFGTKPVLSPTYANFDRICDIAYTYLQKFRPPKSCDTVNVSELLKTPEKLCYHIVYRSLDAPFNSVKSSTGQGES